MPGRKRAGRVTALLDGSGAFDNVSHKRLLNNLRKRKVPAAVVQWVRSSIAKRRTKIVLPENTLDEITVGQFASSSSYQISCNINTL
jgi:hypothetical protein